jgi:hypothetical protein
MQPTRARQVVAFVGILAAGVMAGTYLSEAGRARAQSSTASLAQAQARALEALIAKDEIRRQIYNYARGLDRMDMELAVGVWHPDGTADYGGTVTKGSEFVEGAFRFHESFLSHTHHMIDTTIEVDGDNAVSETNANSSMLQAIDAQRAQGVVTRADGVSVSLIRGRYADRWSKRDGRWALDHRRYIEDFRTVQEMPAQRQAPGRRDRTDPSYTVYPF